MWHAVARAALMLTLAWANGALAGQERQKHKAAAKLASGVFVSAKLEDGAIKWELLLDEGGGRTFEMPARILVAYSGKGAEKRAHSLRPRPDEEPEAKERPLLLSGKFLTATVQGDQVLLRISAENAATGEIEFWMAPRQTVRYREDAERRPVASLIEVSSSAREGKPRRKMM